MTTTGFLLPALRLDCFWKFRWSDRLLWAGCLQVVTWIDSLFGKPWSGCIVRAGSGLYSLRLAVNVGWCLMYGGFSAWVLWGRGWGTDLSCAQCFVLSLLGLCPSVSSRIFGPKHIWMLVRARLRSNFGKNLPSLEGNSRTNYKKTQERQMD